MLQYFVDFAALSGHLEGGSSPFMQRALREAFPLCSAWSALRLTLSVQY